MKNTDAMEAFYRNCLLSRVQQVNLNLLRDDLLRDVTAVHIHKVFYRYHTYRADRLCDVIAALTRWNKFVERNGI